MVSKQVCILTAPRSVAWQGWEPHRERTREVYAELERRRVYSERGVARVHAETGKPLKDVSMSPGASARTRAGGNILA